MALDPLATAEDVEARTGQTFTGTDLTRIDVLLRDASAAVRSYTGQQISSGSSTIKVDPNGRNILRLPQRPVIDVTSVVDYNSVAVAFLWDGVTLQVRRPNAAATFDDAPSFRTTMLTVVYEHGYTENPPDVVAIVCSMVARAFGLNPLDAGRQSETIEGYAYTIGSAGAAGAMGLLPDERAILDRYRTQASTIRLTAP